MTRPQDLAARIRQGREALEWSQTRLGVEVAKALGRSDPIHYRVVQGWESGRTPRYALRALEEVLGVDLTSTPESTAPRLDEATDAQLIAELAGRMADRDRAVRELRQTIESAVESGDDPAEAAPGRWVARHRDEK